MYGWVVFGLAIAVVLLTSVFKTIDVNSKVKSLIAVVLSIVAGATTVWATQNGDFSTINITQAVALVYAASQVVYDFIFKGTGVDQALTSITPFGGGSSSPVDEQPPAGA
jgi:hypothetical protein